MRYAFDDYTLDPEHYELRQAGRLVRLEPRVFDLLVLAFPILDFSEHSWALPADTP
jgi:hypothetical protein